jgi:hypothetical protein
MKNKVKRIGEDLTRKERLSKQDAIELEHVVAKTLTETPISLLLGASVEEIMKTHKNIKDDPNRKF